MLQHLRKHLSPSSIKFISNSFPYRLYSRWLSRRQEIRFSCELTTKCNILCNFCTRTQFTQKGNRQDEFQVEDMSDEIVDRILEEIEKFYHAGIPICFAPMGLGEPILYKKFFETCERVKKISSKIRIVLVTNGVKLTEEDCEKILFYNLDEVSISLNANNPLPYREHMGVDKYEVVYNNIERLISLCNKNGNNQPSIFIQYIDFNNRENSFSKDIRRWGQVMKNNDKCYVHPIVNQGGFYSGSNFNPKSRDHFPCTQPSWRIAVKLNGDLYPCDPAFYSGGAKIESLYLGNIKSSSPYKDYMDGGSKAKNIMSRMRRDDYTRLPDCDSCNTYKLSPNIFFKIPFSIKINGYKWF